MYETFNQNIFDIKQVLRKYSMNVFLAFEGVYDENEDFGEVVREILV